MGCDLQLFSKNKQQLTLTEHLLYTRHPSSKFSKNPLTYFSQQPHSRFTLPILEILELRAGKIE